MDAVKTAEDKKYVLMNAPKERFGRDYPGASGYEEPDGDAVGTGGLVFGTYSAG